MRLLAVEAIHFFLMPLFFLFALVVVLLLLLLHLLLLLFLLVAFLLLGILGALARLVGFVGRVVIVRKCRLHTEPDATALHRECQTESQPCRNRENRPARIFHCSTACLSSAPTPEIFFISSSGMPWRRCR